MIFEYWMDPDNQLVNDEYSSTSATLRTVLADVVGFGGVERFESCSEPGKFVAIGFFDDEAAVTSWRNHPAHRRAQQLGRDRYFTDYRLRMADLVRDYGQSERAEAPAACNKPHEGN